MKRFLLLSLIFAFCQPVVAQRLSTLEFQKFQFDDDTNIAVRIFMTDAGELVTNNLPFHLTDRERAKFTADTNGNLVVRVIPTGGNFVQTQALNAVQADVDDNALAIVAANSDIDANENRIIQLGISAARDNALTTYEMDDSFVDGFTDETGIETGVGSNFTFNAGNNTYEITAITGDVSTDLILLLKCDENVANTTVADSSGQGNDGVSIRNTSLMNATGKVGDGFDLVSASLDDVTFSVFDQDWHKGMGVTSITISYWLALDDWTPVNEVFHRSQVSGVTPMFIAGQYQTATVTMRMADDANDQVNLNPTESLSFVNGTFHHIVYVWNAPEDRVTVFMDGVQVITGVNASIDAFTGWQASQNLSFGVQNRNGVKSSNMNGIMDAIYMWLRPITTNEVLLVFNEGNGTEGTDLSVGGNAELISKTNFHFAASVPVESRVLFFLEEVESVTLNVDLVLSSSRDNGTNFTSVVLSQIGTIAGSNVLVLSGTNSLVGQLSGTNMVIRAQTFNEKDMNFKGWGLLYN